jgi:hypothetical protein
MSEESPPLPPRLRLYRLALQLVLQHRLKGHLAETVSKLGVGRARVLASPELPGFREKFGLASTLALPFETLSAEPSPTIESSCGGLPTALPQAPGMRAGEVCHMLPQATIRVPRIRRFQARLEARGCPS